MFTGRPNERDLPWFRPEDRNDCDYDTPNLCEKRQEKCAARLVGSEQLCGKTAN